MSNVESLVAVMKLNEGFGIEDGSWINEMKK